jgi:hypothetical protein
VSAFWDLKLGIPVIVPRLRVQELKYEDSIMQQGSQPLCRDPQVGRGFVSLILKRLFSYVQTRTSWRSSCKIKIMIKLKNEYKPQKICTWIEALSLKMSKIVVNLWNQWLLKTEGSNFFFSVPVYAVRASGVPGGTFVSMNLFFFSTLCGWLAQRQEWRVTGRIWPSEEPRSAKANSWLDYQMGDRKW